MSKKILFALSLISILLIAYLTLVLSDSPRKGVPKSEVETAVNQANYFYLQKKQRGEDFSTGPCLSNDLMPGWVVDIVHSPRQAIDDLAENQCSSYLEGRSKHFVELDTLGNLIRIQ